MVLFSREQLLAALEELVEELTRAGVIARIRIVGGAGIALLHDPERGVTRDVDALLAHPPAQVAAAVESVAERNGWPPDWLNTRVQMYGPDPDSPEPSWTVFMERGGVVIEVATAEMLLAMKLRAARGRRDADDIEALVASCGLTRFDEAVAIFEAHYTAEILSDRAVSQLRRLLP